MRAATLSTERGEDESIQAQMITARAHEIVRAIAGGQLCQADEVQLIAAAIHASVIEDRQRRLLAIVGPQNPER